MVVVMMMAMVVVKMRVKMTLAMLDVGCSAHLMIPHKEVLLLFVKSRITRQLRPQLLLFHFLDKKWCQPTMEFQIFLVVALINFSVSVSLQKNKNN